MATTIATISEICRLSLKTARKVPRIHPIEPRIIRVAGAYTTYALPCIGFQISNRVGPIAEAKSATIGPNNIPTIKVIMSPKCHIPNGRGIGMAIEVAT